VQAKKRSKSFDNKKARFDYHVLDQYEAGIVLNGQEIKAIRENRVTLSGSYAKIISGEVFWLGANLGVKTGDQQRTRKLLLKRTEIDKIFGKISKERTQLIPLKIYLKRGRAKLLLGIGKGKKQSDKRELIKKRDIERENARNTRIK